jgi:hypothetical protein
MSSPDPFLDPFNSYEHWAHWQHFLKRKLEDSVGKQKRFLKSDFTSVAVSITQRKKPNLTKVFPQTSIDWAVIERQLVA